MTAAYPAVIPMLSYENGVVAMDWLCNAFGFAERARMTDQSGRLSHGELQAGDGVIMLATPTPAYQSPAHHREHCDAAHRWHEVPYIVDGVLLYIDDVEQHCRTARAAGARILSELEPEADGLGSRYRAEDLEGHRWMFMQR